MTDRQRRILSLALANTSNHCYANTVVYSLMWASAALPAGTPLLNTSMQRLVNWLTHTPQCLDLWDVRAWRALVEGWQRPHNQHDSAEFLMHLEHALHSDYQMGYWQARLSRDLHHTQVTDHGKMWPMLLPSILRQAPEMHDSVHSVQSTIISWRNQAQRHAAVSLPPVVPLQIGRFTVAGDKQPGNIILTPIIHMPLFAEADLRTTSSKYILPAVIYHLGPTRDSGHYRTLLCQAGRPYVVTDDNQYPVPASTADIEVAMNNSYILFYCKEDVVDYGLPLH